MNFSDQFITIMDYIGEKLGFMIDWTSQNVVPYMTTLGQRIIHYEIATSVGYIAICGIIYYIGERCRKRIKEEWDEEDYAIIYCFLFFAYCILFICVGIQFFDIIKAVTLPEATILKFIQEFAKNI